MSAPVTDPDAAVPDKVRNTLYHGADIAERFDDAIDEEWLRHRARIYKHELIDAMLLLAISNRDQLPVYLAKLRAERLDAAQRAAGHGTVEETGVSQ